MAMRTCRLFDAWRQAVRSPNFIRHHHVPQPQAVLGTAFLLLVSTRLIEVKRRNGRCCN
jgi:hypothetical protein